MDTTEQVIQKVNVSGKGKTQQQAFASALNGIQKQLITESDVMLRVEPMDIEVLVARKAEFTERFLFFFLPRKNTTFEVELLVTVKITRVKLENIPFIEEKVDNPQQINIPFLSKHI